MSKKTKFIHAKTGQVIRVNVHPSKQEQLHGKFRSNFRHVEALNTAGYYQWNKLTKGQKNEYRKQLGWI